MFTKQEISQEWLMRLTLFFRRMKANKNIQNKLKKSKNQKRLKGQKIIKKKTKKSKNRTRTYTHTHAYITSFVNMGYLLIEGFMKDRTP